MRIALDGPLFVLTSMRILHEFETTDPAGLKIENEVEMNVLYQHGFSTKPSAQIHCVPCTTYLHTHFRCFTQTVAHPHIPRTMRVLDTELQPNIFVALPPPPEPEWYLGGVILARVCQL